MTAPKEAFYDEHISPLMNKIIDLCKEAKINMIADFSLGYDEEEDQTLFCTTAMPNIDESDEAGVDRMMRAYKVLKQRPDFAAFTIITKKTDN